MNKYFSKWRQRNQRFYQRRWDFSVFWY